MPPKIRFITCEVCGNRSSRKNDEKRLFMAKFPLDEDRCRQWVKLVGKQDLIHVPIEKLHTLKYVCEDHFEKRAFNEIGNRLLKSAIPSKNLKADPLPDELLLNFPSHVYSNINMRAMSRGPAVKCDNEVSLSKVQAIDGTRTSGDTDASDDIKSNARPKGPVFLSDHSYSVLGEQKTAEKSYPAKEDNKLGKDINITAESEVTAVTNDAPCDDITNDAPCDDITNDAPCDDITNDAPCDDHTNDDDDDVPNVPVPEAEAPPQELFSWEKTDAIIADATVDDQVMTLDLGDVSMYNDGEPKPTKNTGDESTEYRCNECGEIIKGFRYTCVQCCDFDLCAACEARAAHSAHYVLRVPGDRPYKEIQAVLAAIRHQMLTENLFLPEMMASVKEEVKDEAEAEEPEGAAQAEPDPLGAWDLGDNDNDEDCDVLENHPEQNDEDSHPPRKRRKSTQDPLAYYEYFMPHDDSSDGNLTADNEIETIEDFNPSDDEPICNSGSNPIEIIDVGALTRTEEQRKEDCDVDNNDTIEIPNDSDIGMAVGRCVTLGCVTEEGNDAIELKIEKVPAVPATRSERVQEEIDTCIPEPLKFIEIHGRKIPLKDLLNKSRTQPGSHKGKRPYKRHETVKDAIDTSNPEPQKFIEIYGQKLPLKPLAHTSHHGPSTEGKISHSKEIGSHSTGTALSKIGTSSLGTGASSSGIRTSSLGIGQHSKVIGTSKAKNYERTMRYKIRMPPGDQWKQLLMKILNTKVTVQLEDVMRKKSVLKTTEINEI